jgi:hypothetical protein
MIFKVKDNGWFDGTTFVEVNQEPIIRGDYYLSLDITGKPISIELCDSEDLAQYIRPKKSLYKKIIKSSQPVHRGSAIWNHNVTIDKNLITK